MYVHSHQGNEQSPCQDDFGPIADQDKGYLHCIKQWAKEQYQNMNCPNGKLEDIINV